MVSAVSRFVPMPCAAAVFQLYPLVMSGWVLVGEECRLLNQLGLVFVLCPLTLHTLGQLLACPGDFRQRRAQLQALLWLKLAAWDERARSSKSGSSGNWRVNLEGFTCAPNL